MVRLTQMVKCAGCAAKIPPAMLKEAVKDLTFPKDKNVLVGIENNDDAGIYKINEDLALIQTTDFFTPVVDDPYVFGQIAASNALSDVYAMGGKPITALNIVGYPKELGPEILSKILQGGADKLKEAECSLLGGHSVSIPEIIYGMAITGVINPNKVKDLCSSQEGDILILTKALGTGVLNTAAKFDKLPKEFLANVTNSMLRLNKNAAELMQVHGANGCTDVTGFSLMGHAMEMAKGSGVVFEIDSTKLPLLPWALEAVGENCLTGGDKSNRVYTEEYAKVKSSVDPLIDKILFDPQTSGGLLISVKEEQAEKLLNDLKASGDEVSEIIGKVMAANNDNQEGTIVVI